MLFRSPNDGDTVVVVPTDGTPNDGDTVVVVPADSDTVVVVPADGTPDDGDTVVAVSADGDTVVVVPADGTPNDGDTVVVVPTDGTPNDGDNVVVVPADGTPKDGDTVIVGPAVAISNPPVTLRTLDNTKVLLRMHSIAKIDYNPQIKDLTSRHRRRDFSLQTFQTSDVIQYQCSFFLTDRFLLSDPRTDPTSSYVTIKKKVKSIATLSVEQHEL